MRWTGTRSSGGQAWRPHARRTPRGTRRRARARSSARRPRGGRRGAAARRSRPAARRAGRTPGSSGPSPCPRSPSSAISTAGRWWRSAIRDATIPITPGCQPSAASTYAGAPARALRHQLLGLEEDPRLDVAALDVDGVELGGDRAGARDVGRQQQLEAGVGAMQPPGGVDPRREPEADRAGVDPARVDARDLHQRLQARLARGGQRAQALAHQAPVLADQRHAVGDGRERDEVQVGVGVGRVQSGAVEQRAGEQVRDAGRAQLRARVAADAPDARSARRAAGRRRAASGGRSRRRRGRRRARRRPPRRR